MIGPRFLGRIAGLVPARSARRSMLNRAPWPVVAYLTPWLSIALASVAPGWPLIASFPLMPPLGFLMLLGWRQLHPGLLPVWAGLPLGLFDDLVSGQPVGSGVLLWSAAMLGLEAIELRWPWRNFLVEWSVSSVLITAYLAIAGLIANGIMRFDWVMVIPLQILVSILVYPLVGRLVAWLDRVRLTPFRTFG
jgi:rod shape-determining protein MreD